MDYLHRKAKPAITKRQSIETATLSVAITAKKEIILPKSFDTFAPFFPNPANFLQTTTKTYIAQMCISDTFFSVFPKSAVSRTCAEKNSLFAEFRTVMLRLCDTKSPLYNSDITVKRADITESYSVITLKLAEITVP